MFLWDDAADLTAPGGTKVETTTQSARRLMDVLKDPHDARAQLLAEQTMQE